MKKLFVIAMALLLMLSASACEDRKQQENLSETTLQTESSIGVSEEVSSGSAKQDTTCDNANIGSEHSETPSEHTSHNWSGGSCTEPKVCAECGATEAPSGHTAEEWILQEPYYAKGTGSFSKFCEVCGEVTETSEMPLESLHADGEFLLSPYEFYERFRQEYAIVSRDAEILSGESRGQFTCAVMMGGKQLGVLFFSDGVIPVSQEQKHDATFKKIYGSVTAEVEDAMSALVKSCDPALDYNEANSLALEIIRDGEKTDGGIIYRCTEFEGGGTIEIELK